MGVFTGTYFVRYDEELKSPLWKGRIIEELSCGYYLVLLTFCSIPLDSESVQMICTSPPYWGLRRYATSRWEGGNPECGHEMRSGAERANGGVIGAGIRCRDGVAGLTRDYCKCGARRIDIQLGLEKTPEEYVSNMVAGFREVRRVLRDDGSLWLVLGDSYNSAGRTGHGTMLGYKQMTNRASAADVNNNRPTDGNLKPKDLCMIPARVAMALQWDGWYLRSMIPWIKRNAMPESCQDRPTNAVEYIFLLSKSQEYFYDGEAVKMPDRGTDHRRNVLDKPEPSGGLLSPHTGIRTKEGRNASGRLRRNSDWFFESWQGLLTDEDGDPLAMVVNTAGYKGAHFATFSPKLVDPMIKAGTSEKGCCPKCRAPWKRVTERKGLSSRDWQALRGIGTKGADPEMGLQGKSIAGGRPPDPIKLTIGWQPSCKCDARNPVPCIVYDPFVGSGTVCMVAQQLGRIGIGSDLAYQDLAVERIGGPLFAKVINSI